MRERPAGVPAEAVWDAKDEEWVLAEVDSDGREHGLVIYWRCDGSLACHADYRHGTVHGSNVRYHESGEVASTGTYVGGVLHGVTRFYRSAAPTSETDFQGHPDRLWRYELIGWHGQATGSRWYDRDGHRVTQAGDPYAEYSPVPELNLLKELQDRVGSEAYADGFALTTYGDTFGLECGWSKEPEFLSRLIPFARANGSGSEYALWRLDDRADLATLPVVVFGDEGGEYVVARDLRELLQLLGYDCEISVWPDEAYFYRGEDYQHRPSHEAYLAWLQQHLGLPPADDPKAVITTAQAELGQRFATWVGTFLLDSAGGNIPAPVDGGGSPG